MRRPAPIPPQVRGSRPRGAAQGQAALSLAPQAAGSLRLRSTRLAPSDAEIDNEALLELFKGTSDAMIGINTWSRIVAWNPGAVELFGQTPEDVLGKYCGDVFSWRDRHGNQVCGPDCAVRRSAEIQRAGETLKVLSTAASGRAVWLSVSSLVLPREYHRLCRVVHFVREVVVTPGEGAALHVVHDDPAQQRRLRSLTAQERAILDLLMIGLSTADIAARLFISRTTVQNHVAHILAKLGVHSRLEAVALARPR